MDLVEALQLQALHSVLEPDEEYLFRKVFRWYSSTYHTPLHEVETLPLDYVLRHYFEAQFESMGKKERKRTLLDLTDTPEEKAVKHKEVEAKSDDAFLKRIAEQAQKDEADHERKQKEAFERVQKAIAELGEHELIPTAPSPSDEVNMSFADNNLFGDEQESLTPPPKPER